MKNTKHYTRKQMRLSAEWFRGGWSVSIGRYPAYVYDYMTSSDKLAEGCGKTLPEAIRAARAAWKELS